MTNAHVHSLESCPSAPMWFSVHQKQVVCANNAPTPDNVTSLK